MPHPTRTAPRPLPSTVLDQIARQIVETHAGTPHATLVRVRPGPTRAEVGLCALPEGVHPTDALVGHVVPPDWVASGVIAPARARALDRPGDTGTATTVVMLVGRDGHVTSHAVGVDGVEAGGEPPVGRIPELLRRTLGLPTEPPERPAAEWWRAYWLDALVSAAADEPGRVPDPDRPLTSTLPPALVQALVDEPELCHEVGWPRLRALAAAPEAPDEAGPAAVRAAIVAFVDPATAAWLDDGSFARWLIGALPSVDELLELAEALVPTATFELLREVSGRRPRPGDPLGPPEGLVADPPGDGATNGEPAPQGARGGAGPPR
jgi:hypothetical protein